MRAKQDGFTLLEALVAMVLLASVGMALLSWVNQLLFSLQRVETAQQRQDIIANALPFVRSLNFTQEPEGEVDLGLYQIRWQSALLEGPKNNVTQHGIQGNYEMTLYDVAVEVMQDDAVAATFSLRRLGWRQVKFTDDEGVNL